MFSLCQHRARANALARPSGHRRRRRGRRRDGRRVVRLLPADRRASTGSCWSRRACSARARAAGPPAWSGSRAARRRRSASASGPAGSTWGSATSSAPTPGSSARATCCRASPRPRSRPPASGWPCRPRSASARSGWSRTRWTRSTRRWRPARRWAARSAPTTGSSARRATSPPTPWRCCGSGVTVAEHVAFRGLLRDGDQVPGVQTSDGPVHAPLVVLTGGPKLAAGGRAGRDPHPGRRGQAPGRGDRAAPRPAPGPGAHGLRPERRAVLAARGGRPAVRDEQPGRAARREPQRGRRLPGRDAGQAGGARPGHRRPRPAPRLGRHHRLHPRPPADHRPGARPGRAAGRGHRGQRRRRRA